MESINASVLAGVPARELRRDEEREVERDFPASRCSMRASITCS